MSAVPDLSPGTPKVGDVCGDGCLLPVTCSACGTCWAHCGGCTTWWDALRSVLRFWWSRRSWRAPRQGGWYVRF